ncbi:Nucleoside permease nupC [Parageobacillus genomosp. 1]|uniref:Nucleoside permease nupC n=1 Tax=Parageobacillus genomosp. 1 TaxID=1295642 RepID=A0ABC9VG82_9BACL|nr:hypothetical protein [Parageobacillus genomosp. 1]EZP77582.1 Nucleoside permease nupC [Parageobacillus genomosp. 1]
MKEWNPVFTREQIEQAKRNGVSYLTLYARVINYGWDIDEAIHTPPHDRFGNDVKSILPEEAVKIAEQNGLSRVDIWNRLNAGWTLEKAIHTPKTRRKLHIPAYALEIAKKNGITRKQVSMRLRILGWTLEEAITKPVKGKGKVS